MDNQFCCSAFKHFVGAFKWLSVLDSDPKEFVMPHHKANGEMWRVNYCPSCGVEIRNMILIEDDLTHAIYDEY